MVPCAAGVVGAAGRVEEDASPCTPFGRVASHVPTDGKNAGMTRPEGPGFSTDWFTTERINPDPGLFKQIGRLANQVPTEGNSAGLTVGLATNFSSASVLRWTTGAFGRVANHVPTDGSRAAMTVSGRIMSFNSMSSVC